ncbi:hypothetical protein [Nocardioides nitrophenolicus]|uniref:hypothetical protein n=1 Tax=Nocardioides nitrophenolicus TaxID=60489 RepID=UPI001959F677|nr:hypothetical protein [Nocardioides nitrophenolicus]MBM7516009.1 hypothetical protein [Nocardioides nitrophenolicus]
MISRVLRPLPTAVLAAALALTLAGCADDTPGEAGRRPSAGPSTPGESSSAASETGSPTPTVTPATGRKLSVEGVSLRLVDLPKWHVSKFGTSYNAGRRLPSGGVISVLVGDILAGPGTDTEQKAVSYGELQADDPVPTHRVADRVVDGVNCFVLEGQTDEERRYVIGAVVDDRFFTVEFTLPVGDAEADAMVEQMFATIDVKG